MARETKKRFKGLPGACASIQREQKKGGIIAYPYGSLSPGFKAAPDLCSVARCLALNSTPHAVLQNLARRPDQSTAHAPTGANVSGSCRKSQSAVERIGQLGMEIAVRDCHCWVIITLFLHRRKGDILRTMARVATRLWKQALGPDDAARWVTIKGSP